MNYYDQIAEGYDELHKNEQLNKLRIIKENLDVGNSLLDVGCGTGFSLDFFKAEKKVGIDPSKELIKQCKHKCIEGKAEALPFKDNSFDSIICVTAAHHFKDLKKGVDEIKRVAKENVAFSLLKKSNTTEELIRYIKESFKVIKEIDEGKDFILICKVL